MLRRRPVMRTVARTAVIAGTASAVAGRVNRHQQNKFAEQDQAQYEQQQAAAAPTTAPAPAVDPIERIKELAQLKDQGILTEEEFTAQKAKLLAT